MLKIAFVEDSCYYQENALENRNMKSGKGKIIPNGVILEPHEYKTVVFFTELGYDVELIPEIDTPNVKNPDILMKGVIWEMKAPEGKGKTTIEHIFRKAAHQSENIILDLRRFKGKNEAKNIRQIKQRFERSSRVRRLYIIAKNGELTFLSK